MVKYAGKNLFRDLFLVLLTCSSTCRNDAFALHTPTIPRTGLDVRSINPTSRVRDELNCLCMKDQASDDKTELSDTTITRRFLLGSSFRAGMIAAAASTSATLLSPDRAYAKDELFKKNPLTNGVLEQIRIWEQEEADNLQYDGVLAPGDAGNKGKTDAYPRLLVPILVMNEELTNVNSIVEEKSSSNWKSLALEILNQPQYDKKAFKKTFNAFADNIYYADPDRANLYLGGGATPKTEQSLAYLQRNEILTNVEDLRAELEFLIKNPTESDYSDAVEFSKNIQIAMKSYLELVPPPELKAAQELLLAQQ